MYDVASLEMHQTLKEEMEEEIDTKKDVDRFAERDKKCPNLFFHTKKNKRLN